MKNILITGGAGFIGSNLTVELLSRGYYVTILDNLSSQIHSENEFNFSHKNFKFIQGDVRVISDWKAAIKDQDAIIHYASETGTGQSMYEIKRYTNVNVVGTSNLFHCLSNYKHKVRKIILASSRAVYGEGKYFSNEEGVMYPCSRNYKLVSKGKYDHYGKNGCLLELRPTDEKSMIQPSSVYAITKSTQEQIIMLMGKALSIPTVALRYQNVYGPKQSLRNPYTGILSVFSTRILNGNNIHIYEDGLQSRDFVFISDVVAATILSLENQESNYHIFNVGSGNPTSVNDIALKLTNELGIKNKIKITGQYRIGDIRHNYACLNKIKKVLDFEPKYDVDLGIKKFVSWLKTQKVQKDNYLKSIGELKQNGFIK